MDEALLNVKHIDSINDRQYKREYKNQRHNCEGEL